MGTNIPPIRSLGPIPGRSCLRAKLYPNGECAVWKEKTYKPESVKLYDKNRKEPYNLTLLRMYVEQPQVLKALAVSLGLSPLPNFDSLLPKDSSDSEDPPASVTRYGTNGITSYGARRVRNACYLIEKTAPKMSTVFATVTVPDLPVEDLARLHQRWHIVVEAYRRKLRRRLQDNGLSGESVTVSEIQTKRYERSGLPVLHLHTVFRGRGLDGKPVISTKAHDQMWLESLIIGCCGPVPELRSACNLQWVKKSAEGYLGKYMTKGTKLVRKLCEKGFDGWLPKQWWSISASLGRRIDQETRSVNEFAEWLNDVADIEGTDVWLWHRNIQIEMMSGDTITIARYGKLHIRHVAEIQAYYSD